MVFIGIDPGSVSGAVGAVLSNGDYLDSFMICHQDKHVLPMVFKNMILRLVDPKEGAEICCESVHSMPNQGYLAHSNLVEFCGCHYSSLHPHKLPSAHGVPSALETPLPPIKR